MKKLTILFTVLLSSTVHARVITETSIPFAQICVTRVPDAVPSAVLGYQTADSAGHIVDEKTVPASTIFTDQERAAMKGILETAFLRLHQQLSIPTPTPTPELTPTPTPTPEPTPTPTPVENP